MTLEEQIQSYLDQGASPADIVTAVQGAGMALPDKLPPAVDQYVKGRQLTGGLRYPAMAGSEALAGATGTVELPERGINLLTQQAINPVLGTSIPAIPPQGFPSYWETKAGLINNPQLRPETPAERIGAGIARGAGAAAPLMIPPLGGPATALLPAGAAAGGTEAAVGELFPNAPPLIRAGAGLVAGGALGGAISGVRGLMAEDPEAAFNRVVNELAVPPGRYGTPTLTEAGQDLKKYLTFGNTSMDAGTAARLLGQRADRAASAIAGDPEAMPIIRAEVPYLANKIATARLNINGAGFWDSIKGAPEAKEALVPNHYQILDNALTGTGMKSGGKIPSAREAIGSFATGELLGGIVGPKLIPGAGEFVGGQIGGIAALGADAAAHYAARAIVDPWLRWSTAGTTLGAVGNAPPAMGFRIAPQQ